MNYAAEYEIQKSVSLLMCHIANSFAFLCCHEIFNSIVVSKPFLFIDTCILYYFSPRPVDYKIFLDLIPFYFILEILQCLPELYLFGCFSVFANFYDTS